MEHSLLMNILSGSRVTLTGDRTIKILRVMRPINLMLPLETKYRTFISHNTAHSRSSLAKLSVGLGVVDRPKSLSNWEYLSDNTTLSKNSELDY